MDHDLALSSLTALGDIIGRFIVGAIVCGFAYIVLHMIFHNRKPSEPSKEEDTEDDGS